LDGIGFQAFKGRKKSSKELWNIIVVVLGLEANLSLKFPKTYSASHEITVFRTLLWLSDDTELTFSTTKRIAREVC